MTGACQRDEKPFCYWDSLIKKEKKKEKNDVENCFQYFGNIYISFQHSKV